MSKQTHISYNSIEQYRNELRDLKKAKKNPEFIIPDEIEFTGTVKLHGTNCSVCYSNATGMYCQSRNNIINLTYDNQGFCCFVEKNKKTFEMFFQLLAQKNNIDLDIYTLSIYGEWCGERIQKGVALTKLPKCFCIFDCKVSNTSDTTFRSFWVDVSFKKNDNCVIAHSTEKIYNIYDFETFTIKINIDNYGDAQQRLIELTEYVEKCCPFAKKLGVEGIGEGIVWRYSYGDGQRWIFKTKGEEHKVTKEKVLIPIDTEKIESIKEFVENTCTKNRFDQAIDYTYKINPNSPLYQQTPKMKDIQYIINWMRDDILKEEKDTILENNFTTKDIISDISKKVVTMFKTLL